MGFAKPDVISDALQLSAAKAHICCETHAIASTSTVGLRFGYRKFLLLQQHGHGHRIRAAPAPLLAAALWAASSGG